MSDTIYHDPIATTLGLQPIHLEEDYSQCEPREGVGTSTTWRKGNTPWNLGIPDPAQSERMKKRWEEWHKTNKKKERVYIKKGPSRIDNTSVLNKKILTCPHCGKEANIGNAKRWHFDNCGKKQTLLRDDNGKFRSCN